MGEGAAAKVQVALRYDDCSAGSPAGLESRILEACARHRIHCTFGVIPEIGADDGSDSILPWQEEKMDVLRRGLASGFLEVALHGLTHRSRGGAEKSEFSGVPREKQEAMLRRGKALLEPLGGPVTTFIPPWNSYDGATLEAMAANGLTLLSADGQGPAMAGSGVRFVPATCLLTDIRKALDHARALIRARPGRTPMVIAYFHPYEFVESGSPRAVFSLRQFEETLAWLASQEDVESKPISALGEMDAAAAESFRSYSRLRRLVPGFMERLLRPAFWAYPYPAFPKGQAKTQTMPGRR